MAKKGKAKGKGEANSYAVKFVPMPRTWPGKISNQDLFNEFAQKVRLNINANNAYPNINLRIKHLGFEKHHDFLITCEIARIQHRGSVHPQDVIIFKGKTNTPVEKLAENAQTTILQDDLSIGIPQEMICRDDTKTLIQYFPDISTFKCEEPVNSEPNFLHEHRFKDYVQIPSAKLKCYEELIPPKLSLSKNVAEYESKAYDIPFYELWYDILPYIKIKPFKKDFKAEDFNGMDWLSSAVHNQHPPLPFKTNKFDFNSSLLRGYDCVHEQRPSIARK